MNATQIIKKEIAKVSRLLSRCNAIAQKQESALRESQREQVSLQKRKKQLEEAIQTIMTEQDKLLKATGLFESPLDNSKPNPTS